MWIKLLNQFTHKRKELFTLKHSRNLAGFTLKRSRFSAETLPHSIYTYKYIYKKTNSCRVISVDNLKKSVILIGFMIFLTSCAATQDQRIQDETLNLTNPPHKCFKQNAGNYFHPPEFFTCNQTKSWR